MTKDQKHVAYNHMAKLRPNTAWRIIGRYLVPDGKRECSIPIRAVLQVLREDGNTI